MCQAANEVAADEDPAMEDTECMTKQKAEGRRDGVNKGRRGGVLLWGWGRRQWRGGTAEHKETLRAWC